MCNKQVSQPTLSLKLLQKVDNLCLDGNIQSRNWLIAYNKSGLLQVHVQYQHAGAVHRKTHEGNDLHALPEDQRFPEAQLPCITFFFIGSKTVSINSLCYNIQNFSSRVQGCIWILEIICILLQSSCLCFVSRFLSIFVPSKVTVPSVGSYRWITVLPKVDLPHPDSPTRPRVSPL